MLVTLTAEANEAIVDKDQPVAASASRRAGRGRMAGGGTTRDRETRGHEAAGRQAFGASRHSFRPEVQALRALAVALVVVFHLWPGALPGGFVGVDVFFVISGFLITGQLLREAGRLGRIRLGGFWARRVRRLLPAALASLAATGIATWLVAPQTVWRQYFSDIAASAAYVQNWHLVAQAVDYFAPSGASPVQNFWSLAVEEQFYLVWPLLLVVALVATRRRPGARRRAFVAVLGAASVASLIYCIVVSRDAAQIAYLSTLARGWEFGLGGLLALVLPRLSRLGERAASRNGWAAALSGARAALSWCGVAVIVVSAFLLNSGTAFPGAVALWPTLATCVVIAAGVPRGRWAPGRAMTLPAVQWLGGASYSLYLWHWPVIVLAPFAWERIAGRSAPAWSSLLVLALSLALAWASKRWIEDRTRTAAFWSGPKPTRSFAVMAAGMMVVGGLALACAGTVQTTIDVSLDRAANVVRVMPPCLGAASITGPERHTCEADPHADPLSGTASPGAAVPSPAAVHEDIPKTCQASPTSSRLNVCSVGVPASSAVRTVALVGDSHAAEWEPALERVANREGWHVVMLLKGSCAFNTSQRRAGSGSREARSCAAWNRKAAVKLQQIPGLDLVIVSADIKDLYRASEGASGYENAVSGYVAAWRGLPSTVQVDVIADTPRPVPNVVDCLALHRGQAAAATACARPRTAALGDDPLVSAAEELPARVRLVTMTDDFCSATTCDPIIGHVTVYRDQSHISATYSATLAPALRRALAEADKPSRNSTGMGG